MPMPPAKKAAPPPKRVKAPKKRPPTQAQSMMNTMLNQPQDS